MRFALILLLCSTARATTHTVSRVTTSPHGIEQTLLAVGSGAAFDGTVTIEDLVASDMGRMLADANPTVWLDGHKVGLRETFAVTRRLRGFLDDTQHSEGSVGYTYYLRHQGSSVTRSTWITDGQLILTTTISGGMGRVDWARLTIVAVETSRGTTITGTLTAHTPIGDRCRLVNRIAHRRMGGPMLGVLNRIERRGREMGRSGSPDLLGVVQLFVQEMTVQQ